jgi:hypothetical protein
VFAGILAVSAIGLLAYKKLSALARDERIANELATLHRCLLGEPGRVDVAKSTETGDVLNVRIADGPTRVLLEDRMRDGWTATAIVSMPHGALIVLRKGGGGSSILRVDPDGTIVDASAGP